MVFEDKNMHVETHGKMLETLLTESNNYATMEDRIETTDEIEFTDQLESILFDDHENNLGLLSPMKKKLSLKQLLT